MKNVANQHSKMHLDAVEQYGFPREQKSKINLLRNAKYSERFVVIAQLGPGGCRLRRLAKRHAGDAVNV
jgi:hypothetical protein